MGVCTTQHDEAPADAVRGGAVTIGNFDGVHLGHQALLAELRRQADTLRGPAVALTFDPHPLRLLRPADFRPVLTTVADRAALLQAYGADHVVVLRTTPDLLNLTARAFFERVLRAGLDARVLVPGFNFRFGHDRAGDVQALAGFCREAGIGCVTVAPLELDGRPVSSSRVRGELERGDVGRAGVLLGRPYRLRGVVGTGQRRGQALGFPTANLERVETLVPAEGVYAARAHHAGTSWPAAVNVGPNPTFGEQACKIEAHLIGFRGDLYGQPLALDFLQRLRDTRPFAGAAELVRQLHADVEEARRIAGPEA
ncbi:MAG: riboflavin biosynthesis protein RibF [Gemmataceae bacterium]|nr:riboflavin biosynthesis protein RibF [Gemmataceae bacterium]